MCVIERSLKASMRAKIALSRIGEVGERRAGVEPDDGAADLAGPRMTGSQQRPPRPVP